MHFEGNGFYPVTVRAVDGSGAIQTDKISDPQPGGSTGHMGLSIYVKGFVGDKATYEKAPPVESAGLLIFQTA